MHSGFGIDKGVNITRNEDQHKEEYDALERERLAFLLFQKTIFAVKRQFLPLGNGAPADDRIVKFEAAKIEYDAAKAEVKRIVEEIRTGKRR